MIADKTMIVDGQTYHAGDTVPDLGSIECIDVQGNKREYRGLFADFSKLPKYDNLATGSSILFLDTGNYAEYLSYDKTWYLI